MIAPCIPLTNKGYKAMQNHHTDLLTYEGTLNKILVYQKGLVGFSRYTTDPIFNSKKEAQRFYAPRCSVDSMPHSDLWYQKGKVYRRLFPTTQKACKALLSRLGQPYSEPIPLLPYSEPIPTPLSLLP